MANYHTHRLEKSTLSPSGSKINIRASSLQMNPQMDQRADRSKTEHRDTYRDNCRFQSPTTMLIKRKTNFPLFFVLIVVTNYYEVITMKYVLTTCGLTTAPNSSLSTILTAHEKSKLLSSNSNHPSQSTV